MQLIITVENAEQAEKIKEVLSEAEEENTLDFTFSVEKYTPAQRPMGKLSLL